MSREKPIEDLEVSVRTARFLADLGVKTVGELLAMPEIRAPRLVAAELEAVFEEMELAFPGRIAIDTPTVVEATGEVMERWTTISTWLEEHHPQVLAMFHAPATADAITAAEQSLGRTLPSDYKHFLMRHNGQEDTAPMVGTCSLFSVESLAAEYKPLHDLFESEGSVDEEFVGEGVRPIECSTGWIPIGRSARGRDFLCIDLDPAKGGHAGQIIAMSVDFDDRPRVATSFTEFLSVFFERMQTGEIELDDEPE